MDANALAGNPKRIKIEGQCSDENEDKISHVPDSVLHYILSFLPAKDAVTTSTLSTRWRYLWTAIHNFEFYDELHYATKKQIREKERLFFNFVDKVLFVDDISKIQRFSLTCQEFAEVHFKKWIRTIMRRKVEELFISVTNKSICYFPYDRFSFEPLRIIKIDMDVIVNIPALLCFANLKVLTLKRVAFCCGKLVKEVSINCPVLKELIVSDWTWLKIKKVNISVPMLQKLKINGRNSSHLHDCEIKIYAESLVSVQLDMVVSYEYSLCGLSSLVDAYINLSAYTRIQDDTIAHRLVSLLSGIYNVRDLDLSLTSIEVLSAPAFSSNLHSLSQLKHLRISHGYCTSISGRQLINFLSYMPKIETLSFICGIRKFVFKGNGRMLGTTGESFLSGVKLIDMHYFRGIRDQQWFIKFLIKSVRSVDKWTIGFTGVQDQRMIAQLTMLAKDSNCVLEFK